MTGTERFLVDAMCGTLATYLRMAGYDTAYALDLDLSGPDGEPADESAPGDDELLALAEETDRRLVTRDRRLAALAPDGILLESRDVVDQLRELAEAGVELELGDHPSRCGACNGPLVLVDPSEPTPDYAPERSETEVYRCEDCGQHFWTGSHWDDVAATLDGVG